MQQKLINRIYILLLILLGAVCAPLIVLGFYNYPMADDWSMGVFLYKAATSGTSAFGGIGEGVRYWFLTGEPRFSAVLFGVMVPSAFGNEHFYYVVSFLMISGLIISELYFFNCFFRDIRLTVTVITIPLILQILCVPFPTETFYWYVGSVNYTFINSISLILIALFFKLSSEVRDPDKKTGRYVTYVFAMILAVLVGGNNFGTSLSRLCLFGFMSLVWLFANRKKLLRTLPVTMALMISLVICLLSPGSEQRLAGEYADAGFGAVESVWRSVVHAAVTVYAYTDLKILILMFMIIPFIAYGLTKSDRAGVTFKYPLLFTAVLFLVYASEIVPNYYVEGGVRAQRMADIFYYDYYMFMISNVIYWTGWFVRSDKKIPKIFRNIWNEHAKIYLVVLAAMLLAAFCIKDLRSSSSYRAAVWLVRGYASEYKDAWENRLKLLKDPTVTDVEFESIDLYHELVYYADLTEDAGGWLNEKCAEYYGKNSVIVSEK